MSKIWSRHYTRRWNFLGALPLALLAAWIVVFSLSSKNESHISVSFKQSKISLERCHFATFLFDVNNLNVNNSSGSKLFNIQMFTRHANSSFMRDVCSVGYLSQLHSSISQYDIVDFRDHFWGGYLSRTFARLPCMIYHNETQWTTFESSYVTEKIHYNTYHIFSFPWWFFA